MALPKLSEPPVPEVHILEAPLIVLEYPGLEHPLNLRWQGAPCAGSAAALPAAALLLRQSTCLNRYELGSCSDCALIAASPARVAAMSASRGVTSPFMALANSGSMARYHVYHQSNPWFPRR